MLLAVRFADLSGIGDSVLGVDRWTKLDACKCAVNTLQGIEGWRGTITHTETFEPPPKVTQPTTRTVTNTVKQPYDARLVLTDERGGGTNMAIAQVSRIRETDTNTVQDVPGECAHHWKTSVSTSLTGRYADDARVQLAVFPTGRYTLVYTPSVAEETESVLRTSEFSGSCNPFNAKARNYSQSSLRFREGVTGSDVSGTVKVRVTWDLARCVPAPR